MTTVISEPASVVRVMVLAEIDLMVPTVLTFVADGAACEVAVSWAAVRHEVTRTRVAMMEIASPAVTLRPATMLRISRPQYQLKHAIGNFAVKKA
jgi:hypothetical protein